MKANTQVFVDTSGFKALVDVKDEFHERAVKIWEKLKIDKSSLITTNFILDESYTLIRLRCGIGVCRDLRTMLTDLVSIKVMRVSLDDELLAWDWFEVDWSGLSFTDCTCFAMMKRLDLSTYFGFDKHFERAGIKPFGV